jgi:hypothetical protein
LLSKENNMRITVLTLVFATLAPAFASAKESALLSSGSAIQAREDIRVLGRLNVNLASREEMLSIPGMDATTVDAILAARAQGALNSLAPFNLPVEVMSRLSVEGASTLRRIRVLPLEVLAASPKSATR